MCPPPRLLITSGMIWGDMDPVKLVKQVVQLLYGNCSRYREWVWPLELVHVVGTNQLASAVKGVNLL